MFSLSSFYGFSFIPVAMWSLVPLSLVSARSEENGSVFALFMIHPSPGHCSSSLGVRGQRPSIPCSCFLTYRPLYPLLLCRHQPALLLPPLLPSPSAHLHSCPSPLLSISVQEVFPLLHAGFVPSPGFPSPAFPIAYPLSSPHSDFFSVAFSSFRLKRKLPGFCLSVHYHPIRCFLIASS